MLRLQKRSTFFPLNISPKFDLFAHCQSVGCGVLSKTREQMKYETGMRTSFKRPDVAQCSHREAMDGSTDRLSRKTRSVSAITVFSVTRIKREHVHADLEHVHAPLSRRRRPTRVLAPQRCTNLRVLGPGSQVPRRGTAARLPTRRPQVVFESELLSAPLHRNGTFLELARTMVSP